MSAPAPATRPWRSIADRITLLAPSGVDDTTTFLDATFDSATPAPPFADERMEAVAALSAAFLEHPLLRRDPASVAAAFWMRKAQLHRLREGLERRATAEPGVIRVAAGRVLHMAPANVDTLFLYSWVLGFLCGNAGIVRLSRDAGQVVSAMLEVVSEVASSHAVVISSSRFLTWDHDDAVTGAVSAWCSQRVLWGGDATVQAIRPLALPPHAGERVFGTKFSYAVLSAGSWRSAAASERARVAAGCFNDLFWFDQMACSSPSLVFWVGSRAEVTEAVAGFDEALQAEAARRAYRPAASAASHRRGFAFEMAADDDVRVHLEFPAFVSVRAADGVIPSRETCGGGLLRHHRLDTLASLASFATEADQTLTHWGFSAAEIVSVAEVLGSRGVDRVVPVGEALAFESVWDGFDLMDDFTRRVRVRA